MELLESKDITFTYTEKQMQEAAKNENVGFIRVMIFLALTSIVIIMVGFILGPFLLNLGLIFSGITLFIVIIGISSFKANKATFQRLAGGVVCLKVKEDEMLIKEEYPNIKVESIVKFDNIAILNETDELLIIKTKTNRAYLLVKTSEIRALALKQRCLEQLPIYNGVKVDKTKLMSYMYDYHLKDEKIIRKVQATNCVSFYIFMLIIGVCIVLLSIPAFNFNPLVSLLGLPLIICGFILIHGFNKKLPTNEKLIGDLICLILFTISVFLVATIGLVNIIL